MLSNEKFHKTDDIELKDIRYFNVDYHKDGTLVFKKIGEKTGSKGHRKKKNPPFISIDKVIIPDDAEVNEKILQESRELYKKSHKLIPIFVSFEFELIAGYEQYLLAQELHIKQIPFQRNVKLNKKQKKDFLKKTTNRPLGNKKYQITDIYGNDLFVTLNAFKKYKHCERLCKKYGLTLEIFPQMLFLVKDKNGKIQFGKSLQGLNQTYGNLKSYDYNANNKGEIADD